MTENDIKSELSYAYLHAVGSRAGCAVHECKRSFDNMGIDAELHIRGQFSRNAVRKDIHINVQLKATSADLRVDKYGKIAFDYFGKNVYDLFRMTERTNQMFVILLRLPKNQSDWLTVTPEKLELRQCAYWLDLYDAPETDSDHPTIYFPQRNVFTTDQLKNIILMTYAEKRESEFRYEH